jgi:hypothetical protein
MIRPTKATLILQDTDGYSKHCLSGYEPKVFVNPQTDLKFVYAETMAVRMGIAIAKAMGCGAIAMMCCGSLVNRNTETFNVWTGKAEHTIAANHYLPARRHVLKELSDIKHFFIIPKQKEAMHG